MMKPKIIEFKQKTLIGKKLSMSFSNNRTAELWRSFMAHKSEIKGKLNCNLISMQIYPKDFDFSEYIEFEKWAAVEVNDSNYIPDGMEKYTLKGGLYAVFLYKGLSSDNSIFKHIFTEWLPASEFILDNRPHFEILGEKYKNNDPESEEEIWIPVKNKLQ